MGQGTRAAGARPKGAARKQTVLISYGQPANRPAAEKLAAVLRAKYGVEVAAVEQAVEVPTAMKDKITGFEKPVVLIGDEWTNNDMGMHGAYWAIAYGAHLPFTATYAWPGKGRVGRMRVSRRYALMDANGKQPFDWGSSFDLRPVEPRFPLLRRKLHIAANGTDPSGRSTPLWRPCNNRDGFQITASHAILIDMSHPYDASTKYLVQTRLADWLPLCGRTTTAELQVIDADLATVTAAADRVLRVCEDPPWLLHLELQASRDPDLLPNLPSIMYCWSGGTAHWCERWSCCCGSRPTAPELTGTIQRGFPGEPPYLVFRYEVVRVWQLSPETFLSGGLGILPLAPLSAVAETELPGVIRRMDERIRAEATPDEAGTLWTAADVLMGMRYPRQLVTELLQGVHGMRNTVSRNR